MIAIQKFGTLADGRDVQAFRCQSPNKMTATLLNYGATLQSFCLPNGQDIVLGFDTLEPYLGDHPYFGAAIGRVANRIGQAQFDIDGQTYAVIANENETALHSGPKGFERQLWDYSIDETGVTFRHTSLAGHQGYPGTLDSTFRYVLDNEGLRLNMRAVTDAPTPVSLTGHSYFNLDGALIDDHALSFKATHFFENDEDAINTGRTVTVANSKVDFSASRAIGNVAIDQHFFVPGHGMRDMATLFSASGRKRLRVFSDLPGFQIYTGDAIQTEQGKSSHNRWVQGYGTRAGIAFEPQYPPNAVNLPHLPNIILRPGEVWEHSILYTLDCLED